VLSQPPRGWLVARSLDKKRSSTMIVGGGLTRESRSSRRNSPRIGVSLAFALCTFTFRDLPSPMHWRDWKARCRSIDGELALRHNRAGARRKIWLQNLSRVGLVSPRGRNR